MQNVDGGQDVGLNKLIRGLMEGRTNGQMDMNK